MTKPKNTVKTYLLLVLQLRFFLPGKLWKKGFLSRQAYDEIRNLKKNNVTFKSLKYNWLHQLFESLLTKPLIIIYLLIIFGLPILFIAANKIPLVTKGINLVGSWLSYFHTNSVVHFTNAFTHILDLQTTIFAALLAFVPIANLLQGAMLKDNNIKDDITHVIQKETKVIELIYSSTILLLYLLYLNYIKIFLTASINLESYKFYLITVIYTWFLINVIRTCYLIVHSLSLLKRSTLNTALIKYAANEIYPRELENLIKRNLFLSALSFSQFKKPENIEVTKSLKQEMLLDDIDLFTLKLIQLGCVKRNSCTSGTKKTKELPFFPLLNMGTVYDGDVALCRIGNSWSLTKLEHFLIKSAFKFKKINDGAISSTENTIEILNESVLEAIKSKNINSFKLATTQYIEFHASLLKLGETTNQGNYINYATISGQNFLSELHQDWARSYNNISEAIISTLNENSIFFKYYCYVNINLVRNVLKNPSLTGVIPIIESQAYLGYCLSKWQEKNKDQETYNETMREFIASWERLQKSLINQAEKEASWDKYKKLFNACSIHLHKIILFLTKSILSNNEKATLDWVDVIIRWNSNAELSGNKLQLMSQNAQIYFSKDILKKSWEEVNSILNNVYNLSVDQKVVLSYLLEDYWKDSCHILACFLLKWAISEPTDESPENKNTADLSKNIFTNLLKGIPKDRAIISGNNCFIEGINDYIISFLRRENSSSMEGVAYQIAGLTKKMIPGRLYEGSLDNLDALEEASLMIGVLIVIFYEGKYVTFDEFFYKIFQDNLFISNTINKLEQAIKLLNTIDTSKYEHIITLITQSGSDIKNQLKGPPGRPISEEKRKLDMKESTEILKSIFSSLLDNIKKIRFQKIKDLPISDEKLVLIAEEASKHAFEKNTADFPVCLFKEIKLVTKPLKEWQLKFTDFPKGAITDPIMDNNIPSENWHDQELSLWVYANLIFDILYKAEEMNILKIKAINGQIEYVNTINGFAKIIKDQGLNPVLITENHYMPQWLQDWKHAQWNKETALPQDLIIEYRYDKDKNKDYLFHLNEIPVYAGRALIGGSLLLPIESLKKLSFRQMDNGYPVDITFETSLDNPTLGILAYKWETQVELENYEIYKISYSE